MSKSYFTLAFLLNLLLIVPLFEAFENPLDDLEKLEEKFGLKKHRNGTGRNDENYITLSSDGPVTFDATISFKASVFAKNKEPPFYYSWSDDASPRHMEEQETITRSAHWNITYPSGNDYESRGYRTTVYVYCQSFFGRDYIGEATINYKVTRDLNGEMVFNQKIPSTSKDRNMIRSTEDTELTVKFHDPSNYLEGAVLQYYWFVNRTNYGPTENNSFINKFYPADRFDVEVIIIAHIPGKGSLNKTDFKSGHGLLINETETRNMTSKQLQDKVIEAQDKTTGLRPPTLKTGIFQTTLVSWDPIFKYNYTGETWINAGKLLRINLTCDGSGPWAACWGSRPVPYNITGNESCSDPDMSEIHTNSDHCLFPVYWYFRDPGVHNILALTSNQVSKDSKVILVNMYNSTVEPSMSVVAIPVISSIIGLCGIGAGMLTFYFWRVNESIETADFDFNSPEEQLEYKTFWERLRDSMLNAFSNSSDDVSHVSSVSSRSIQNPVTSIHYGSIS